MVVEIENVSSSHQTRPPPAHEAHELSLSFLFCQDTEAMVTCMDETRHGLEDGDFVTFEEVAGMTELNGCEPRKITVKGQS